MAKENPSNMTSKAFSANQSGQACVHPFIVKVLNSMSPGLAEQCPDFTALVHRFLSGCIAQSPPGKAQRMQLHQETRNALKKVNASIDFDTVWLILEGVEIVVLEQCLQSLDDLQLYAEANKIAFKLFIDELDNDNHLSRSTLPEIRFGGNYPRHLE
jgi:hypothetical protein